MTDRKTEQVLRAAGYFWAVRDCAGVYDRRYMVSRFGPNDTDEEFKIVSPHYSSKGAAVRLANKLNANEKASEAR